MTPQWTVTPRRGRRHCRRDARPRRRTAFQASCVAAIDAGEPASGWAPYLHTGLPVRLELTGTTVEEAAAFVYTEAKRQTRGDRTSAPADEVRARGPMAPPPSTASSPN